MKTYKIMGALTLGTVLALTSCVEEKMVEEGQITVLKASIEQPTRTQLSEPDGGRYKTLWVENDAIGVFDGGRAVTEFGLLGGAGTVTGEFQGVLFTNDIVAVYPFSICESISGKTVSVNLPEEQSYKEGNIADGAYPMVAVSTNTSLNFRNLCSVLKVSMTGSLKVNYITFLPNDASVKASGAAAITADSSAPQLQMSESATGFVKLVCPSVSLSGTETDFYIVVPAQNYPGGFSLKINTDEGDVVKSIKTDVSLSRSQLYRIAPFECKMDESGKYILFEDKNFESYLIANFDTDGDGAISYDEALAIESIDVNTDNISSLAGIEYMTNLRILHARGSYEWNSSEQKNIKGGILKGIDISKNTKLYSLEVSYNLLTSLDVSNNQKLNKLSCEHNNLSSLDLSSISELLSLDCSFNQLSSLDVSGNPGLEWLYCHSNQLSALDLRKNPKLQLVFCDSNKLSSLDVSGNPGLEWLYCNSNQLSVLDVSKNPALQYLECGSNNLSALDVSCNPELQRFSCYSNQLSSLDVSCNPELQRFSCYSNQLSSLDVSKNPKLLTLHCYSNRLTSLDLSVCTQLKNLVCHENSLTSLKLGPNTVLGTVYCYTNNLTSLDISKNTGLKLLSAVYNPLKTLYIYEGQLSDIPNLYLPDGVNAVVGSEPEGDEQFSVSPTSFDIDGEEQDITVTVTASMEYSLNSTPDWISQKSVSSGTYTFTVSENSSSSARSGSIVFKNVSGSALAVTVSQGIKTYTSSDYSQDGVVTKLQSSTVGKGIDVVFVGDAFADKDQELFNKYVNLGMEAFFTEEPFRSTRERFSIYRIGSVSKNGIIAQEGGDTKFSAEFTGGTNIKGADEVIFDFVKTNLPSVDLTKTIIFVIINKAKYAGTCWMYSNNQAICYVPLCTGGEEFARIVRHEGCGHGFGKLADEYVAISTAIPQSAIDELNQWRSFAFGFYENVDVTSDPAAILWSGFISDTRYAGKVGVYEGGYTYATGVYRPTDYSIMRYNTGGFNAPSREAIYKKIMKFSEGDAWTYDYETFVAFDAPARSAAAVARAAAQCASVDTSAFVPLAPPVLVMVD
ncbi:MAG: M64 family metallopeptidase [Bacteroidia bacterium]|nr:M64 family metallopeptidase [Bacteroidia bacterium]